MPSNQELPDILQSFQDKGDGFTTPDAEYFARLTENVLAQTREPAKIVHHRPNRWWLSVAAVVLLALFAWLTVDREGPTPADAPELAVIQPTSEELLAEISPEAIEAYIGEELDQFAAELYYTEEIND